MLVVSGETGAVEEQVPQFILDDAIACSRERICQIDVERFRTNRGVTFATVKPPSGETRLPVVGLSIRLDETVRPDGAPLSHESCCCDVDRHKTSTASRSAIVDDSTTRSLQSTSSSSSCAMAAAALRRCVSWRLGRPSTRAHARASPRLRRRQPPPVGGSATLRRTWTVKSLAATLHIPAPTR